VALLAVALVAQVGYGLLDRQSPVYDPGGHFLDGILLLHVPMASRLLQAQPLYPPFVSIVAAPLDLLTGYNFRLVAAALGGIFTLVLLASTYGCGRILFGPYRGLLAAALLAVYPVVAGQTHIYMLDVPLAAMVSLTYWLMLRSTGARGGAFALAAGVAIGLGMLTKYTFVFFVPLPLALACAGPAGLVAGVLPPGRLSRLAGRIWPALTRSAGVAGLSCDRATNICFGPLLALCWYVPRLSWFFNGYRLAEVSSHAQLQEGIGLSLLSLRYYLIGLPIVTSTVLASAFLAAALLYFVKGGRGRLLLGSWLIAGYLLLTLSPGKEPRYLLPALPAVALVTAGGLGVLAGWGHRAFTAAGAAAAALLSFGLLQALACVIGFGWLPQGPVVPDRVGPGYWPPLVSQRVAYVPRPSVAWNVDSALEWTQGDARNQGNAGFSVVAAGNPRASREGCLAGSDPPTGYASAVGWWIERANLVEGAGIATPTAGPVDYLVCAAAADEPAAAKVTLPSPAGQAALPPLMLAHEERLGPPALGARVLVYRGAASAGASAP